MLKIWNMTLITLTFALTIFGTFLTRSGVIASVHAFASGGALTALPDQGTSFRIPCRGRPSARGLWNEHRPAERDVCLPLLVC